MNALSTLDIQRARTLVKAPVPLLPPLSLDRLTGRITEVSEAGYFGALTAVSAVLDQAQARGEACVWVATGDSLFYPPDLAFRGLDVEALAVVRVPGPLAGMLAADWLVRSGAFGLVILDWTGASIEESVLGRMAKVAEDRKTAVIFLTRKADSAPSLGTAVSLRLTVRRSGDEGLAVFVTKDKRPGAPVVQKERLHGPLGLY
jgi:hypothetical protein